MEEPSIIYQILFWIGIIALAFVVIRIGRAVETVNAGPSSDKPSTSSSPTLDHHDTPLESGSELRTGYGTTGTSTEKEPEPEPEGESSKLTDAEVAHLLKFVSSNRMAQILGGNRQTTLSRIKTVRDKYGVPPRNGAALTRPEKGW